MKEQQIDELLIQSESDYQVLSHGNLFSNKMVPWLGYILLSLGLFSCFSNLIGGLFLIGIGGFLSLSRCGIILDKNKNAFKEYTSYFFIKNGEWKSLDDYPDAAVLNIRYSQTANMGYFHSTNVKLERVNELVLLTPNHRKKILVKSFKSYDNVQLFCEELCGKFNLNLTKFNPEISAQTRARRRR